MISRIVEISSKAFLSYKDEQLRIERSDLPVANVPLEDLGVLIVDTPEVLTTSSLLGALATYGIAVIFTDSKHLPAGLMLPLEGNALHTKTLREQIETSEPVKKQLWQTLVREKIIGQATTLKECVGKDYGLTAMATQVKSGDPENLEGQAARIYFPKLFGRGFIRDRDGGGINTLLNYSYTIVRAAVARAVVGSGLHPAIGIHHSNQYNAFALADDLMEPLRPIVDLEVFKLVNEVDKTPELDRDTKRKLLAILTLDVSYGTKRMPIMTALGYYAANARQCMNREARKLRCPAR